MILKLKNYIEEAVKKNISTEKLDTFFKVGLELGIFRVVGNEGSEILYETNENHTATGPEVLLNEEGKPNPVTIQTEPKQETSRPASVGNQVSSGFGNPFAGTSWGN